MRFNQRIQALPVLFGLGAFLATGCGGSQDEHAGHDHGTETEVVEGMDADGMAVTSVKTPSQRFSTRHPRPWKPLHSSSAAAPVFMATP